jgi:hypothetical protein
MHLRFLALFVDRWVAWIFLVVVLAVPEFGVGKIIKTLYF